jgi:hypothetical protein
LTDKFQPSRQRNSRKIISCTFQKVSEYYYSYLILLSKKLKFQYGVHSFWADISDNANLPIYCLCYCCSLGRGDNEKAYITIALWQIFQVNI